MNYLIIQLCCVDCGQFIEQYTTNEKPFDFIKNIEDYNNYFYIIYEYNNLKNNYDEVLHIDGSYL